MNRLIPPGRWPSYGFSIMDSGVSGGGLFQEYVDGDPELVRLGAVGEDQEFQRFPEGVEGLTLPVVGFQPSQDMPAHASSHRWPPLRFSGWDVGHVAFSELVDELDATVGGQPRLLG